MVSRDEQRRVGRLGVCLVAWSAAAAGGCAGEIVFGEQGADPDAGTDAAPDTPDTCQGFLEAEGVDFEPAAPAPGVSDPVTVSPPIGGVHYRAAWEDARRESMFMDCELARSLVLASAHLRARDIVEVADMGIYNYRCIGGGDPDEGCGDSGISQHAYALAIDIAGVTDASGDYASVETDWVIDSDGSPTCDSDPQGDKNAMLHDLICEMKDAGVWNIVLTPNYNAAHRDHFHVDLKEGSDFIEAHEGGVDVGGAAH